MSVLLTTKKIIKEWTDYNNHMNLSYYILVFDKGAEVFLSKFKQLCFNRYQCSGSRFPSPSPKHNQTGTILQLFPYP